MKIALFGGSFDPPHSAHTSMVQILLDRGQFDQIWYVPVGEHQPAFFKNMSRAADRLKMLEMIQTEQTRIERCEVESGQVSHTHQTIRHLSQKYPAHRFSFLMGSDQLKSLSLWNCQVDRQCFPQMASEFEFYVYPRQGYELKLPYSNLKLIKEVQPMATSSTQIRVMVAKGQSISHLVDPRIAKYIEVHDLYRPEKQIINFIVQVYSRARKNKAVMAVSGGIDSAVALTLLAKALGPDKVYPVFLPYGDQSTAHSKLMAEFNQIPRRQWREININDSVDQLVKSIHERSDRLRQGNIMARIRMIIIYDLAKQLDALVCGTENKSEHELGYYTRYGDAASDLEPIVHLYKTQVRQLAEQLQLPSQIMTQPPSAGLWTGQTDEEELGFNYQEADLVLLGQTGKIDEQVVAKVRQRARANEFKKHLPYSLTQS